MQGIARGFVWTIGGLIAAALLVYGVLRIINWRDEPPSAAVRRIESIERARPAVADAENAYLDVLGFSAPDSETPQVRGARRRTWLLAQNDPARAMRDFPDAATDRSLARGTAASTLLATCDDVVRCDRMLHEHPELIDAWRREGAISLDRYQRLLQRHGWREATVQNVMAPLPRFSGVLDAQQLYLLDLAVRARAGNSASVLPQLDADLRFWREVLASSDLLISKMIATRAIRRHFMLGGLALRALPADAPVPATWRTPMSDRERSMTRVFAGEWRFAEAARGFDAHPLPGEPPLTLTDRVGSALMAPFFKRQATSNARAARLLRWGAASEVPAGRLVASLDALSAAAAKDVGWFRAYNPFGHVLELISLGADWRGYTERVADVEGVRRAALLAHELRAVPDAELEHAVAASSLRDPFTAKAMDWDAGRGVVRFTGIERGDRKRFDALR